MLMGLTTVCIMYGRGPRVGLFIRKMGNACEGRAGGGEAFRPG